MKCGEVKKLFSDYLMMETDPETTEKIRDHIAACPECREELEISVNLWTKLEVLPAEMPGENLKKGFYQMLEAEMEKEREAETEKGFGFGMLSRFLLQKRLLSPAALMMMVISAFLLGILVTPVDKGKILKGDGVPVADTPVQVYTADQSGVLNMIDAYVRLRTGEDPVSPPSEKGEDPGDMSIFEFFANVAFRFADYFEKIVTL